MNPPYVGVLTFHRCINYGSYWQARCLVEGLRGRGLNAVLIDHSSSQVNRLEWRCGLRPQPTWHDDLPLYRQKIDAFFCAFKSLPLSAQVDLEQPSGLDEFDCVVVGSDEVWNLAHPWYGGRELFYGRGLEKSHLVSYAASFGGYAAENGLPGNWSALLQRFDAISVRDDNSRRIIEAAIGTTPETVLDPCLQFDPAPSGEWNAPHQPYVAVYGQHFSPWLAENVQRWAHSKGLSLISIGYRNDWADEQWIEAGPHDFAHFMQKAEAVVTNFFHGCVFALRNSKPFVCESAWYRTVKVRNLMHTVSGEHHLMDEQTPFQQYESLLCQPLEAAMLQNVATLRQSSHRYLDRVLPPSHV